MTNEIVVDSEPNSGGVAGRVMPDAADAAPGAASIKSRPDRRNRRFLAGLVLTVTVLVVASFWSGTQMHGATARPKLKADANVPTFPLEHRILVDSLEVSGTITTGREFRVVPIAPNIPDGQPIVTRLAVKRGSQVSEGQRVAQVGGEPIFLLQGRLPTYRSMVTGASGDDIAQFQQALARLGYPTGDRPGYFGASTGAAATRMFADRGYAIPRGQGAVDGPSGATSSTKKSAATSITVPASAINYAPKLPATVASVKTRVGRSLDGPLLTLAGRVTGVDAPIDAADVDSVREGMTATIKVDGISGSGVIGKLASGSAGGSQAVDGASVGSTTTAKIRLDGSRWSDLVGQQVNVIIHRRRTRGPVWTVPISAVRTRANGMTFVRFMAQSGPPVEQNVSLGMAVDGFVEIRAQGGRGFTRGMKAIVEG